MSLIQRLGDRVGADCPSPTQRQVHRKAEQPSGRRCGVQLRKAHTSWDVPMGCKTKFKFNFTD